MPNHAFVKISVPLPPLCTNSNTPLLLETLYPGKGDCGDTELSPNEIKALELETHFERDELMDLYNQFRALSSDGGIDKETFEKCMGPLGETKNLVGERLFYFYDENKDGVIDFSEMACALSVLQRGTNVEKLRCVFSMLDINDSGYITYDELTALSKAFYQIGKSVIQHTMRRIESAAFESFDEGVFSRPVSGAEFFAAADSSETEENTEALEKTNLNQWIELHNDTGSLMEAMYQEAIEDKARKSFNEADKDGNQQISYMEFVEWAGKDTNGIVACWLEILQVLF
eukprot:CAMPEP_0168511602 /NCGR_PEP_ID=MMETSP0405-20121227/2236_1 /TAXON_ID=498012 /ORGANISM="Trichosphaerium sp, Strain Am-I-7 wt" /LENGTH=286 /DNA_ID=CAMNT_0008529817 /DNA_START=273 /DNA_END=1133 /DNA_ORIENTATION=+